MPRSADLFYAKLDELIAAKDDLFVPEVKKAAKPMIRRGCSSRSCRTGNVMDVLRTPRPDRQRKCGWAFGSMPFKQIRIRSAPFGIWINTGSSSTA